MDEKKFGAQIRAKRKLLAWTQGKLAKALFVSTDYVSRLEKGERTPSERVRNDLDDFLAGRGRFSEVNDEGMIVSENSSQYGDSNYINAVAAMMKEMDPETQKDIYLSVQKEKLLRDLLKERKPVKKAS